MRVTLFTSLLPVADKKSADRALVRSQKNDEKRGRSSGPGEIKEVTWSTASGHSLYKQVQELPEKVQETFDDPEYSRENNNNVGTQIDTYA